MKTDQAFLEHIAYRMRRSILLQTTKAESGHPTSALSATDIVAALFFYAMRYDLEHPEYFDNDRFVLSKGHASPVLYAVYKELGILTEQDLLSYRSFDSTLEGHPTPRFRWSEAATGSLGQGLSIAVGMALAARIDNYMYKTYVLLGDSELAEGSNWEAAELAAYNKLSNLIGIIDVNRLGQRGQTMEGHDLADYANKFQAFGWQTLIVEGHDMYALMQVFDKAKQEKEKPVMIIARTVKGYGIARVEDKNGFHGKPFTTTELPELMNELDQRFYKAARYAGPIFMPEKPATADAVSKPIAVRSVISKAPYRQGELVATRKAYGQALEELGACYPELVALDAEVSNSTYACFFAERYPKRFVECFVAEQNMIGMAVGMNKRGKIPFCSTFGAFFTRAYDQLRMACVGAAALRLVGSHAGVSIGQDGPSQMALEDIAIMSALYGSIVLYPADGVSAWQLTLAMASYNNGISYLRTTRGETPVIYGASEQFPIGGCKIVRQSDRDQCCIVAAGITLHNALAACERLAQEEIAVCVIDLYSIKPLDRQTVLAAAQHAGRRIITVEDHYLEGGLGQAVVYALKNTDITIDCLAVTKMPRSGRPDELMNYEGIDVDAIVRCVKKSS